MRYLYSFILVFLVSMPTVALAQETDMPGSQDYPDLPRVSGTYIAGYDQKQFDRGLFITEMSGYTPSLAHPEGKRTRILYVGQPDQTTLQILRNYQVAFEQLGEYEEIWSCVGKDCHTNMANGVIWEKSNRIPVSFRNAPSIYNLSGNYRDPVYLYGRIVKDDSLLHVSMFGAFMVTGGLTGIRNRPMVHVEILQIDDFEPTLTFVSADEMLGEIRRTGSVSLYGIQFALDSADLTAESTETVAEIAKALQASPQLKVYVVGHTDNQGAYDYNLNLSKARAEAVVGALTKEHGIEPARLQAAGVGPVAPLAANDSDEGRGLNRRVEIVAR
jgi:outer membrane protein OmpA-like peptidoglycan-associated protein